MFYVVKNYICELEYVGLKKTLSFYFITKCPVLKVED